MSTDIKITDSRGKSKKKTKPKYKSKGKVSALKPKELKKVPLYDNSFEECVTNVTGLYATDFQSIDRIIANVGLANWYKPYVDVLRTHGYDMIFFSYAKQPLELGDEKALEHYEFSDLPSGKCIILGRDSKLQVRCVVALVQNQRATVIYDPKPDQDLSQIFEMGYFIKTFASPVELAE